MWWLFSIFAIFLQVIRALEVPYIIGGHDATPGQFPYMVSIQLQQKHRCGGSIIADEWILTATHCFVRNSNAADYTIVVGTIDLNSGGKRYLIKKIISHPLYQNYTNDITLLQLEKKLTFNSYVDKISLPHQVTLAGTEVVFTGWGLTRFRPRHVHTTKLQVISLVTITNKKCSEYNLTTIQDEDMCTLMKKGHGTCLFDSGGPLVDPKFKNQVGIFAGGVPCGVGVPDVFTRVHNYLDWINREIGV